MMTTIERGGRHYEAGRYSIVPLACGHALEIPDTEPSEPGQRIDCGACDAVAAEAARCASDAVIGGDMQAHRDESA